MQMRHLYFNLKDLFSNRKGFVILTSLLRFKNKSREFREYLVHSVFNFIFLFCFVLFLFLFCKGRSVKTLYTSLSFSQLCSGHGLVNMGPRTKGVSEQEWEKKRKGASLIFSFKSDTVILVQLHELFDLFGLV